LVVFWLRRVTGYIPVTGRFEECGRALPVPWAGPSTTEVPWQDIGSSARPVAGVFAFLAVKRVGLGLV